MIAAIVFAFLLGLALGVVLGRRNPQPAGDALAAPAAAAVPRRTKPSRRAAKAGLTDESFTPADDILERMRKAAEGELDPAELEVARPAPPTPAQVAADAERAERERRVLERLRQQSEAAQPSDAPNDRGDAR